ncbi:MAG: bile acid:sodium symporter family protein [Selenomonas sp.]|nr:bile acid:sodium symporter family protein [Selenomonas sp.]
MERMKQAAQFLASHTAAFVIIAAIIAFFVPQMFGWVKGQSQIIILFIIMFSMGLTLAAKDFKVLASRPLDIFIGAAAQYLIMPFSAYFLSKSLGLSDEIAVGLILVGCCPGGISSNIMSFLCKGDVPLSVGMTTASTLLAPLMTPAMVLLLAGERIEVPAAGMFLTIVEAVIAPVLLGFLLNYRYGQTRTMDDVRQVMPSVAVIGLALIVGGVIALQGSNFFTAGIVIFLAVLAHNAVGYFLGYFVGRFAGMNEAKRRTLSIEVGMQNAGLATGLAVAHFAIYPHAALACAVSCAWHSISGTLLAGWFVRRDEKAEAAVASIG